MSLHNTEILDAQKLSPQDILKEAERSVNETIPLYDWHKQLCSLGAEKQELLLVRPRGSYISTY